MRSKSIGKLIVLFAVLFVAVGGGAQIGTLPVPVDLGTVDLGTLGGTFSLALALNDRGQIVGYSETAAGAFHAFSWTARTGMIDLGTLGGTLSSAAAVNARGQVVGDSITAGGETHAFLWTAEDGMIDLGTLGGTFSHH